VKFFYPPVITGSLQELSSLITLAPYIFSIVIFINILLFSKRTLQLLMNRIILFASIALEIAHLYIYYSENFELQSLFSVHFIAVLVSWFLLIVANKYIKKDEDLIRSVDRLR
jgi:hypothetical protein